MFIFVTGMFRSGTTLLSRIMAANNDAAFASDPFAPAYKFYRNAVVSGMAEAPNKDAPLEDYYFNPAKRDQFDAIQASRFSDVPGPENIDELRKAVASRAEVLSPKIIPHLHRLGGTTFAKIFDATRDIIARAYGAPGDQIVGAKEVWTGEFVPHLLDQFTDARVVYMVRDPRAVAASKNAAETGYPWLFLARQWRKLAALGWMWAHPTSDVSDRVMLLRYEDLVADPENTVREMCAFCDMPFANSMLDTAGFLDGAGNAWVQNSTYGERARGFNANALSRWHDVLSESEIAYIDYLCGPEMSLFGYEPELEIDSAKVDLITAKPPRIDSSRLADWIVPFANVGGEAADLEDERRRWHIISDGLSARPDEQRLAFLDERIVGAVLNREKV